MGSDDPWTAARVEARLVDAACVHRVTGAWLGPDRPRGTGSSKAGRSAPAAYGPDVVSEADETLGWYALVPDDEARVALAAWVHGHRKVGGKPWHDKASFAHLDGCAFMALRHRASARIADALNSRADEARRAAFLRLARSA